VALVSTVRGIEHVGITVPDIEEATAFLVAALGAEVLYDMRGPSADTVDEEADRRSQAQLGTRPGTRWIASRMLRVGDGPSIELFEYADEGQRAPAGASDLGIQHFAVYVDDIDAARERIVEAGGTAYLGPSLLPGAEAGEGNKWLYTVAPWGSIVELVSRPSPEQYEETTTLRRWRPARPQDLQADADPARKERS
jgi:catechol 2,3-dioxygenase-like lactoylglutathione lyase family enzyme